MARRPSIIFRLQSIGVGLLYAAIVGVGSYGWVSNIIKLAGSSFDPLLDIKMGFRAIGIPFIPLGIVMGYVP
jgi:hypothetical protein